MSNQDIIRAWKDEDYRLSLSEAERALLPEHPAGLIELAGAEMDGVEGGALKHTNPFACLAVATNPIGLHPSETF
jgi:mersacidin/lichenicidin family type 2 lantibiotic